MPELFGVIEAGKGNGDVVPYVLEAMRHALSPVRNSFFPNEY